MARKPIAQAIQLFNSGNKSEAEKILKEIVKKEPRNAAAWHWLEKCAQTPESKRLYLVRIVELEPGNKRARKRLDSLNSTLTAQIPQIAVSQNKAASSPPPPLPSIPSPKISSQTVHQNASVISQPLTKKPSGSSVSATLGGTGRNAALLPPAVAAMLDPDQTAAVLHRGSNLLIIAGAGSGKTRTLTYRSITLLDEIDPVNLMVITFTKKAAQAIRERMMNSVTGQRRKDLQRAWIGTIHSICWRILMENGHLVGLKPNWSVLDMSDSERVMAMSVRPFGIAQQDAVKKIYQVFSYSRNSLTAWMELINTPRFAVNIASAILGKAFEGYSRRCRRSNRVDFDDLQMLVVELLKKYPQVRQHYRERFRAILVDEYQDTSRVQAEFIRLLAGADNVTVVGDDAQSIYSFRAATVENILSFEHDFHAQRITIETNYRSTPEIVEFSNAIISRNRRQIPKMMRAKKPSAQKPRMMVSDDPAGEARYVFGELHRLHNRGLKWEEMAVLFRATRLAAPLEVELTRAGVPYIVVGGPDFFSLEHIKVVLDMVRLILNTEDSIALGSIQSLVGFSSDFTVEEVEQQAEITGQPFWRVAKNMDASAQGNRKRYFNSLLKFRKRLDEFYASVVEGQTITPVLARIIHFLTPALRQRFAFQWDEISSDLDVLVNVAAPFISLGDFINSVTLQQFVEDDRAKGEKPLVLSTIHSAKGLEWEAVFIISMVEFWFPLNLAIQESGTDEEERRLFYVAATRAKKHLFLTSYTSSMNQYGRVFDQKISRFIKELPDSLYECAESNLLSDANEFAEIPLRSGGTISLSSLPKGTVVQIFMNGLKAGTRTIGTDKVRDAAFFRDIVNYGFELEIVE